MNINRSQSFSITHFYMHPGISLYHSDVVKYMYVTLKGLFTVAWHWLAFSFIA